MGYTTDFNGIFRLDQPLQKKHFEYLNLFSETRRMKRDTMLASFMEDPVRRAVLPTVGTDGEFFVAGGGECGQDRDNSIINYNTPPSTQPGLWCQWVPNENGTAIEWDGNEKFYCYVEWITYIIANFLNPWGYKLDGMTKWQGEDPEDVGIISIKNNEISVSKAR